METNLEIEKLKPHQGIGANAVLSLVFGILSYFVCFLIFGIIAWVMGSIELSRIKRGVSSDSGSTIAKIGMWLGIVNVILSVGIIIFLIIITIIFPAVIITILNEVFKVPDNQKDTIEIIFRMLTF